MKRLIYGSLFLALVGMGLIGCKKSIKEPMKKDHQVTTNNVKETNSTKFTKILSNKKFKSDSISEFLANLHFTQYSDLRRVNSKKISFKANQTGNSLIINNKPVDINSLTYFIHKYGNEYFIEDNTGDFQISYSGSKASIYIIFENQKIKFNDLTDIQIKEYPYLRKIPIYLSFLLDFTKSSIDRVSLLFDTEKRGDKYVGTGVGFHRNLADAKFFCQRDYNAILKAHPGWWSPGISYSCVWGEHLCLCTADFYM